MSCPPPETPGPRYGRGTRQRSRRHVPRLLAVSDGTVSPRRDDSRFVRWLEGLAAERPWRGASRAELEPVLSSAAPEDGRPAEEVLDFAVREILPVATRVDHPRFFAFVPSSATWPGVLADFLAAGYNTFQGTWLGSGGPSQIELVVLDWFREWVGYPETAGGLFTSGGSAASLDAFVAAREAAGGPERPVVYMSDQAHSALVRAATIVGVRPEHVEVAAALRVDRVREMGAGLRVDDELLPPCVVALGQEPRVQQRAPEQHLVLRLAAVEVTLGAFAVRLRRGRL